MFGVFLKLRIVWSKNVKNMFFGVWYDTVVVFFYTVTVMLEEFLFVVVSLELQFRTKIAERLPRIRIMGKL